MRNKQIAADLLLENIEIAFNIVYLKGSIDWNDRSGDDCWTILGP